MSNAFDMLNSNKISDFDFKQVVCPNNKKNIRMFFNNFNINIDNLKSLYGMPIFSISKSLVFKVYCGVSKY